MSGIFISYRRSDNPDATGRIYDRLVAEFGKALGHRSAQNVPGDVRRLKMFPLKH